MSKTFSVKTWSMVLLAGLLSAGAANATTANAETPSPQAQEQAQNRCTGVITDEEGEPLVGATVRVQGTSIAASANIDGEFTLAGVKVGSTIVVNYIGYQPMSVKWDGKPLSIVMKSDGNTLEEVVVMGYGIEQKRANVTNSIAKVSEKTLTVGSNANPAQALAGAVSGVKVNVTTGNPSATPEIVAVQTGAATMLPLSLLTVRSATASAISTQMISNLWRFLRTPAQQLFTVLVLPTALFLSAPNRVRLAKDA